MNKTYISTKVLSFILVLGLLVAISSCKSKKGTLIETSGTLKSKTHDQVLDDVLAHELDYKTITTKGSVELKGKKVTTIFKIVKDELLQASVRPILGVEVMRIDITPEKIVILDRLKGEYAEETIIGSKLDETIAFNFYNLQALLTNQLFLPGKQDVSTVDYESYNIISTDETYILQTKDKNGMRYNFSVDPSERIISTNVLNASKKLDLKWSYSQFVEDNEFIYPTEMNANLSLDKKKIAVSISYSKLDINTNFNVDQSIPSKYKKLEIIDVINSYMKIK